MWSFHILPKLWIFLLGLCVASAQRLGVTTCRFTIDNTVLSVYYNGVDITKRVTGNLLAWDQLKTVSFQELRGGVLAISGQNSEAQLGAATAQSAGFLMFCSSTNPFSFWSNLESDSLRWMAAGSPGGALPSATWFSNDPQTSGGWSTPQVSTSGFSCGGCGGSPVKIWGSDKFSFFRIVPSANAVATCRFTIDNAVNGVYYNGVSIFGTVKGGDKGAWDQVKEVSFIEVPNAIFAISGYNYEGTLGQDTRYSAGFMMQCTSTNPSSNWNGFVTDRTSWVAAGSRDGALSSTWFTNDPQPGFTTPLSSTSGFHCNGCGTDGRPEKIWGNDKYSFFRTVPAKDAYNFIGCFTDDGNRDLEDGPKAYGYSKDSCSNACSAYPFFSLQHEGWCVCGNAYGTTSQYVQDRNDGCGRFLRGGGWRNAVYGRQRVNTRVDEDGWVKVFHQVVPNWFGNNEYSSNPTDLSRPKYSILDTLELFRGIDGKFELRLVYPEVGGIDNNFNQWKQTSNPVTGKGAGGSSGYEAIVVPFKRFGWVAGMENSGPQPCLLDGSQSPHDWWWYCIGLSGPFYGGYIPGPAVIVNVVELYVKTPAVSATPVFTQSAGHCRGTGWSSTATWPRDVLARSLDSCKAMCLAMPGCTGFRRGDDSSCFLYNHVDVQGDGSAGYSCYKRGMFTANGSPANGWYKVFRQVAPNWFFRGEFNVNPTDMNANKYAILDTLESFRTTQGNFEFLMAWPQQFSPSNPLAHFNHWKQTSNPVTSRSTGSGRVTGYEPVRVYTNGYAWGGLENGGTYSLLDGSVNIDWWWYAVGSFDNYGGGIPGPMNVINTVELYVFTNLNRGKCPSGFTGTYTTGCTDINECLTSNGGCDLLAICTNTDGSRTCGACPAGFSGTGETSCVDVNECLTGNGGCDMLTSCTNTPGSRTCGTCPSGYTTQTAPNGNKCVDIDECASGNGGCSVGRTCINAPGSFSCGPCAAGYNSDGASECIDINECLSNFGGCDPIVVCSNTPGSRTCGKCPPGYTGTGDTSCIDIDECQTNNGGCDKLTQCTNTIGSRECSLCPLGYSGLGSASGGCVDINECAVNNGGCHRQSICTNTPGSRSCGSCPDGFDGDGENGCVDRDECAVNSGGCDELTVCINTRGSRECGSCPPGYTGTGTTGCVDIDECAISNGECDHLVQCINTPGNRTCANCPPGYQGSGYTQCIKPVPVTAESQSQLADRIAESAADKVAEEMRIAQLEKDVAAQRAADVAREQQALSDLQRRTGVLTGIISEETEKRTQLNEDVMAVTMARQALDDKQNAEKAAENARLATARIYAQHALSPDMATFPIMIQEDEQTSELSVEAKKVDRKLRTRRGKGSQL